MSVTHDQVRHIAALARLAVPAERLDALAAELNGILVHMDALSQVDGASVDATDDAAPGMRLAADHGPPVSLVRPPAEIAPAWRDGFFLVPRLATHDALGAAADDEADG